MGYYFAKTLTTGFDDAVRRTTEALKSEGFGIITEIDVKETFKKKITSIFAPIEFWGHVIRRSRMRHFSSKTKWARCCLATSWFRILVAAKQKLRQSIP